MPRPRFRLSAPRQSGRRSPGQFRHMVDLAVNDPAPDVAERISMMRSPISVSGIIALTTSQPAQPSRVSKPRICPRRPDMMH